VNPNLQAPVDMVDPAPRPHRSLRSTSLVGVLVGLAVAVLGAPLGVLWHFIAPTVPVVDAGAGGFVVNDPSPEEYIAADGWFTIIGFAFGLILAIAAWMVLRRDRGPSLLLGVVVGALAAAPLAWFTGRLIGRSAYEHWRTVAATGGTYAAPPDLHSKGALLVPAFAAVIVLTLLAGWSNDPDLERPGAKPGYGSQLTPGAEEAGYPDYPEGGERWAQPETASGPEISSGLPDGPDPTAGPAPHGPGPAAPPHG
jgi:hypothetical protein